MSVLMGAKQAAKGAAKSVVPGQGSSKVKPAYGLGFRFSVRINDLDLGRWQTCSGLKVEFKAIDVKMGGEYLAMAWLPDRVVYPKVVLKRAADVESSAKVQTWLDSAARHWVAGEASEPSDVRIKVFDSNNDPVLTWVLTKARPSAWSGPDLDSTSSKVAIETLELVHEGFEVKTGRSAAAPPRPASPARGFPTLQSDKTNMVKFEYPPEKVVLVRNKDERASYILGQGNEQTALLNKAGVTSYKMDNLILDGPTTRANVDRLLLWATEVPGAAAQAPAKGGTTGGETGGEKQLPSIKFQWGTAFDTLVQLVGLTANYTRFSSEGEPLRATVSFTLDVLADQPQKTRPRSNASAPRPAPAVNGAGNPTSGGIPGRASHLLLATDSLPLLAREHYGSPGAWRDIARANGIDDPLRVRAGSRIYLPAFTELTEVGERR